MNMYIIFKMSFGKSVGSSRASTSLSQRRITENNYRNIDVISPAGQHGRRIDPYGMKVTNSRKQVEENISNGAAGSPSKNISREKTLTQRCHLEPDDAKYDKSRAGGFGPRDFTVNLSGIEQIHPVGGARTNAYTWSADWTARTARFNHPCHQGVRPTDPIGCHKEAVGTPSFNNPISVRGTPMQNFSKNDSPLKVPSKELQKMNATKSGFMTTIAFEESPVIAPSSPPKRAQPPKTIHYEHRIGLGCAGMSHVSHEARSALCMEPISHSSRPNTVNYPVVPQELRTSREKINKEHFSYTYGSEITKIAQNNAQARAYLKARDRGSESQWYYHCE